MKKRAEEEDQLEIKTGKGGDQRRGRINTRRVREVDRGGVSRGVRHFIGKGRASWRCEERKGCGKEYGAVGV